MLYDRLGSYSVFTPGHNLRSRREARVVGVRRGRVRRRMLRLLVRGLAMVAFD